MPKKCYCGNGNLEEYSEKYYRCDKCHTLVSKEDFSSIIYDIQNEDEDLYGSNYWKKIMEDVTGEKSFDGVIDYYLRDRVIYWLTYILKYIPIRSKVAEVGCGLGQLAYVMRTIGYEQIAFELSPQICAFIEKNLGVNMHCGDFGEADSIYDAVLAFDLLEHLEKPVEFLNNVYKRLTERGVLCIQMPNYDDKLSYHEMLKEKPRFLEQMKEEQHIFLYSKEAITILLRQVGFKEVIFEPACFGDDYDMFLFAAKERLMPLSEAEVEKELNEVNAGRIVKALAHLYRENKELRDKLKLIENDSAVRLKNVEELEKRLEESEKDRTVRLENVEELTQKLEESEKDRATRLERINELEEELRESEKDRTARLEKINELEKQLGESEKDRAARLEVIENCNKQMIELDVKCNTMRQEIENKNYCMQEVEKELEEQRVINEKLVAQMKHREQENADLHKMLDLYLLEIEKMAKKKRLLKR